MISRAPAGTSATISLPQLRAFGRDAFERTGMSGPAWSEYFIPLILGSSSTTPAT